MWGIDLVEGKDRPNELGKKEGDKRTHNWFVVANACPNLQLGFHGDPGLGVLPFEGNH